jgi:hypothetical protein
MSGGARDSVRLTRRAELSAEAQRLRQHVAQASQDTRTLETELRLACTKIEGLERQPRAVA